MFGNEHPDYSLAASEISGNPKGYRTVKVAILGDSSTQHLTEMLRVCLHDRRLFAEAYEGDFGAIDQDVFDPGSPLYEFKPDVVWLNTSTRAIQERYYSLPNADQMVGAQLLEASINRWEAISRNSNARIVQNLFALPSDRLYGNYSALAPDSFYFVLRKLNWDIMAAAKSRKNVFLNDLDYVLSYFGRREWEDSRYWYNAKLPCSPSTLPAIADSAAEVIATGLGQAKKCVIVDLDNTLWGGVIGEDGLNGIALGGMGLGEAFIDFQRYLRALKERGILIAVCSKNNAADAMEPFKQHPDMVLKPEDIAVFKANWNAKSENIAEIVSLLNIGMDSIVFLDDSPFERNEVRSRHKDICVPEMPEDPADFVPFLNNLGLFETVSISAEDKSRASYYKEEADREILRRTYTDISAYLESLEMRAVFARFDEANLPRIAQLIQRSNQFNLTTSRFDQGLCEKFASDHKGYFPVYLKLRDKFGDYGLIAVIVMRISGETLFIDEWVMSCRVLRRGVERFCIKKTISHAPTLGISRIQGTYKPSPKNELVKELYAELGFQKVATSDSGETTWALDVGQYQAQDTFIRDEEET